MAFKNIHEEITDRLIHLLFWTIYLKIINFFCYYDIGTKFPPHLAMINFRRGIRGAYKVGSPLLTEFSPYA
jgi:hypothetical protein